MIKTIDKVNSVKKKRIKIKSLNDFNNALKIENYNFSILTRENFKKEMIHNFNISEKIIDKMYKILEDEKITYKVSGIIDFINYIGDEILFEEEHNNLCKKISDIRTLIIDRVEYERILTGQDDVEDILRIVDEIKNSISRKINEEGKLKLEELEDEIDRKYIYSKDIELLKRIILFNNKNVKEDYDKNSQIKTLIIEVPKDINFDYVKAEKGSVEYYKHIKSYIPRMKRLIKNLDKYIIKHSDNTYKINQSIVIQDSVNMAIAIYNDEEFRAVSGKNDIENSCTRIPLGKEYFESCKVNKLGKLGIGYNRVNDSEKKIFERIHKLIENGSLSDEGQLILYSKWEPCPSCYYVISQFSKIYPKINLEIMYYKEYGEK